MIRYDARVQQWMLWCQRCFSWHRTIYGTVNGDRCLRCLGREEKEAA